MQISSTNEKVDPMFPASSPGETNTENAPSLYFTIARSYSSPVEIHETIYRFPSESASRNVG